MQMSEASDLKGSLTNKTQWLRAIFIPLSEIHLFFSILYLSQHGHLCRVHVGMLHLHMCLFVFARVGRLNNQMLSLRKGTWAVKYSIFISQTSSCPILLRLVLLFCCFCHSAKKKKKKNALSKMLSVSNFCYKQVRAKNSWSWRCYFLRFALKLYAFYYELFNQLILQRVRKEWLCCSMNTKLKKGRN